MACPGNVAHVTPKDWKEAKHFDAEEGQTEDVGGRWEARGEYRRCHQGGIGRQGSGKFSFDTGAVVKGKDIDDD